MKKINFFYSICLSLLLIVSSSCNAQKPINWTPDQLMEPATLAKTLEQNKNLPIIISVGPGAIIPHSIDIGMPGEKGNLDKLKKELSSLPKDANVVIYCGCCPFEHCPNVRPAIDVLNQMKFTNFHLLNLPKNIKTDWIAKGYPTVD